jgi:UDP-N-acetylglucosamine 1-carboxyvinyltransferase
MGAQITMCNSTVTVTGVDDLIGAEVEGKDIRASAALMIAGLRAQGITRVSTGHHLARGYERFVEKAQALGADITVAK